MRGEQGTELWSRAYSESCQSTAWDTLSSSCFPSSICGFLHWNTMYDTNKLLYKKTQHINLSTFLAISARWYLSHTWVRRQKQIGSLHIQDIFWWQWAIQCWNFVSNSGLTVVNGMDGFEKKQNIVDGFHYRCFSSERISNIHVWKQS